jgi:phage tail-like protein
MALAPVIASAAAVAASPEDPAAASRRAYLREALPPVYRDRLVPEEEPPIERFVGALERVLDPIVLQLDNLAAHLDPRLTGPDWVDALTRWLGMGDGRGLSIEVRRALLEDAMHLNSTRGTLAGLRHVLKLTFPDIDIRATDNAVHTIGTDEFERPPAPEPRLIVTVPVVLDETRRAVLLRVLEDQRPVHIACRLVEPGSTRDLTGAVGP